MFSAVARSATSSSYLRRAGETVLRLSSFHFGHETYMQRSLTPRCPLLVPLPPKKWGRTREKSGCWCRPTGISWRADALTLTVPLSLSVAVRDRSGSSVCGEVGGWKVPVFLTVSFPLTPPPCPWLCYRQWCALCHSLLGSAKRSQACRTSSCYVGRLAQS